MHKDFIHITSILDKIDQMQASHIQSFETELMPDLASQIVQRKTEFDKLKKSFALFISNTQLVHAEDKKPIITDFIDRINIILVQNEVLEERTKAYKYSLQESIKEILKGRKAIGLYGSPSSFSNRPRAIDLTN